MVSWGHRRRSIEAWTKSAVDETLGGGTERVAHTGFERVRTIACGRLPRDICWGWHVRGAVDSSRCANASVRKNTGSFAASFQKQSSSFGFAPRGVDARSTTNLVKQTGCIPREPAGIGAFSNRSMVEAGKSLFAKSYQTVDGIWRRDGVSATPRSRCGILRRSSRRAMQSVADSCNHWIATGLTTLGASLIRCKWAGVDRGAWISRSAPSSHNGWGTACPRAGG